MVVADRLASLGDGCLRRCAGAGDPETALLPAGAEVAVAQELEVVEADTLVVLMARRQQLPSRSSQIGVEKPVHARELLLGTTEVCR